VPHSLRLIRLIDSIKKKKKRRKYFEVENCMVAVTLNLPSYTKLGLVTLNLLSKLLTQCGLDQRHPGKQLGKLIAG